MTLLSDSYFGFLVLTQSHNLDNTKAARLISSFKYKQNGLDHYRFRFSAVEIITFDADTPILSISCY